MKQYKALKQILHISSSYRLAKIHSMMFVKDLQKADIAFQFNRYDLSVIVHGDRHFWMSAESIERGYGLNGMEIHEYYGVCNEMDYVKSRVRRFDEGV